MEAKLVKHKGEERIAVFCNKNSELEKQVRNINGRQWSKTLSAWHVPNTVENKLLFNLASHTLVEEEALIRANTVIPQHVIEQKDKLKKWMVSRRYSSNTINTYTEALTVFLGYFSNVNPNQISNQHLIDFNHDYILKNKLSSSYQNQIINAVKLYFATIHERKIELEKIYRPKREHKLPNVLSKEEIKLILNSVSNIKHKSMLSLVYSCGLRRSELLNLKITDIDSRRNLLMIRQAKGKKDRIVPLSVKILEMLRQYYTAYKPKIWLFEGQSKEIVQYDESSLAAVLKSAVVKAKINKPVTLHWLRHSYATHLLESGTDLRYIQEILGHSRSTTTEIYTHVSTKSIQNVSSPFDSL